MQIKYTILSTVFVAQGLDKEHQVFMEWQLLHRMSGSTVLTAVHFRNTDTEFTFTFIWILQDSSPYILQENVFIAKLVFYFVQMRRIVVDLDFCVK